MTQITQAYWLAVQRKVSQYKGDVQRALLRGFDEIASKLNEKELARLVETGGVDRLVSKMLPVDEVKAAFKGVSASVKKVTRLTAENTVKLMPKDAQVGTVAFDVLNPDVIVAIDELDSRVMQTLVENVRETVRSAVKDGLAEGAPAKAIAKNIRASVGLAPNQEKAVRNFDRMLREGDSEALSRTLRDKRFDSTLRKVFADGGRLSDSQVNKMVNAYRQRFVAFHADTVARTATLDASKLGQNIAWQGAIDSGAVDETSMLKRWVGVKDDREREEHLEMEGETVLFKDEYSNGEDIPGESTYNCRCISFYFQDQETARKVVLTGGADPFGDTADRASGIIGTIQGFLETPEGGTIDEIMTQLQSDFPERNPEGMKQTVKTQLNRLAKTTGKPIEKLDIEGRGKVFRFQVPDAPPPAPPPPAPPPVPPPGSGVIATVKWFLERPEGGTVEEIMAQLRKDFPERDAAGMLQTVKTQLNRLPKTVGKELEKLNVPDRGRVFRFKPGIENTKPLPTFVEPKNKPPTPVETAIKKLAGLPSLTPDQMEAAGLEEFEGKDYIKPPFAGNGVHLEQVLDSLQSESYMKLYTRAMEFKTEAQLRKIVLSSDLRMTQGAVERKTIEQYLRTPPTNKLPPLVVRYNGQDWVVDGHHRLTADMLLGKTSVEVRYINLDKGMSALKDAKTLTEAATLAAKGEPEVPLYIKQRAELSVKSFQQNERSRKLWAGLSEAEQEFVSQRGYVYADIPQKNYGTFFPNGVGNRKGIPKEFKGLSYHPSVTVRKGLDPTRAMGTAAHEMGHGLDYAYGWQGDVAQATNLDARYGVHYWSEDSGAFQTALHADLDLAKEPAGVMNENPVASYNRRNYIDWINLAYKKGQYGRPILGLSREMLFEEAADMISAVRYGEMIRGRWTAKEFIDMFPNTANAVRKRFIEGKM